MSKYIENYMSLIAKLGGWTNAAKALGEKSPQLLRWVYKRGTYVPLRLAMKIEKYTAYEIAASDLTPYVDLSTAKSKSED